MLEHRYDIRLWESCIDPNPLMVERQDQDNCIRFQTRERCALEIAAYVFKIGRLNIPYLATMVYVSLLLYFERILLSRKALKDIIATLKITTRA